MQAGRAEPQVLILIETEGRYAAFPQLGMQSPFQPLCLQEPRFSDPTNTFVSLPDQTPTPNPKFNGLSKRICRFNHYLLPLFQKGHFFPANSPHPANLERPKTPQFAKSGHLAQTRPKPNNSVISRKSTFKHAWDKQFRA